MAVKRSVLDFTVRVSSVKANITLQRQIRVVNSEV